MLNFDGDDDDGVGPCKMTFKFSLFFAYKLPFLLTALP